MPISQLPAAPARTDDAATFISKTDVFLPALTTFVNETNALASNLNSIAAGGGVAIPYTVDLTSTANSDPGSGKLRFNSTTQSSAVNLFVDLSSSGGTDVTGLLDDLASSSSAIKGKLRLVKVGDATKWLTFDVVLTATYTGYRSLAVTNAIGVNTNPFVNGDAVVLLFQRTGDVGTAGTLVRRTTSLVNQISITPNVSNTDLVSVSGQAQQLQILAPTGTPNDGQSLMVRVKDSGVAQLLAFASIYRAGTDIPLPSSTTTSKVLYMGFIYNSPDVKWDLVSVLTNI